MVSVIVPVYNVFHYIDKCLDSIVNQTYKELEIILINDGSTDGSEKKCEQWAKKDKRIKYVSKVNEGLGKTRNLGVTIAQSEYIMFVDPDDWVDVNIVEKTMSKLLQTNSDISICDRYEIKQGDESCVLVAQEADDEVIDVELDPFIISKITPSQCAKLFKKSLYTKNDIKQPEHYYEDAVTPVLLALSRRICYVKEPLYYYVIDRGSSITNSVVALDHLVEYLKTSVLLFQKHNLFAKYKKALLEMCFRRINWNLFHAKLVLRNKYLELYTENMDFLKLYWSEDEIENSIEFNDDVSQYEKTHYIWGSYNLMIAMKMYMRMRTSRPPQNHYAFSSIISAFDNENGSLNEIMIDHQNDFRKTHLLKEFKREFANKNAGEFLGVDYLIIDFLEERFDIGKYNGKYFTISDAFDDREAKDGFEFYRHARKEREVQQLWRDSCLKFIEFIRRFFKNKTVVLVKMKLSEEFGRLDGETRHKFKDYPAIRDCNNLLEEYYDFFQNNCPEAKVVEVEDSEYYFTDADYRHGCYPWHLNYYMYTEIRDRIKETIWNG